MELMFNILTYNDTKKLDIYTQNILTVKENEKQRIFELNEKYLNTIYYNRIEYEKKVNDYMLEYENSKNIYEKVNIKPPIIKPDNIDIYTYEKPIFQFKENENDNVEIERLKGKLIDFGDEYYIVNICNVTSRIAKGLTKEIFDKYPDADIYTNKIKRKLGDIIIKGKVINIVINKSPNAPKEPDDTSEKRLEEYEKALDKIGTKLKNETVVFKVISEEYLNKIKIFANKYKTIDTKYV